jgi:heme exporter protein A
VAGECWRLPGLPVVYLGHRNGLKDELTVLESAQLMQGLRGVPLRAARLESALSEWGLWGRRHQLVRALSQGLRRRVALLRLELSSPDALWLLDEPADALDALGTSLLRKRLVRHREQGGAWLITSHVALFEPGDPDVPELHLGAEPPACG